jgi:hypothetical protein
MLSDEDKTWISQRFEEQLGQRFEEHTRLLRQELNRRFEENARLFQQALEKVETTLLTEFHKWASPQEMRQRTHAAAIRALDAEVESLSDRLKNLEQR